MKRGEILGIRKARPDELGEEVKRFVIGNMPAIFAPGLPCFEATVRFQCGDLFFTLLDALVYPGNEFDVGGRTIKLEKGQKLWIVNFRTKEDVTCLERHASSPYGGENTDSAEAELLIYGGSIGGGMADALETPNV